MSDRQTLGLIPARSGSKGVPRKNLRTIGGHPMIAYSIRAANSAHCIDSVVVSTDDEEIADMASEFEARVPFIRPSKLATDEAPTEPVISHALDKLSAAGEKYDYLVLLQPTSPLRTAQHIEAAYQMFHERGADSLISGYPSKDIRWRKTSDGAEQINYTHAPNRRQDRNPEYIGNGAIYIVGVETFREAGELTAGQTALYEMKEFESVDIDTPFDMWLADQVMENWQTDD